MKRKRPGQFSAEGGAVTIKQVAAKAGVSVATVSRVLSRREGGSSKARARVLQAAQALDYHPNRLAQGLRRASIRKVIGVIIPDLQNPFLTGVIHGVESVLYTAGYTLLLGHSDGLAQREQTHVAVMRGEGVSGLILIPANEPGTDYASLKAAELVVVAVDRMPTGLQVDLVTTNNREGTRSAVNHLISHGYRDIAFINGPAELGVAQERLGGYLDALRGAGLPVRESQIVHSDFRQEGGHLAMRGFLAMPQPPRAVVVANNLMTLGALQAIHEAGIRAPEEIAIVGFDDMAWAASLNPPLTAVAQPMEEMGVAAAQLLLDRLKDPTRVVRQVMLPAELRVRASCGCPRPAPAKASAGAAPGKLRVLPRPAPETAVGQQAVRAAKAVARKEEPAE